MGNSSYEETPASATFRKGGLAMRCVRAGLAACLLIDLAGCGSSGPSDGGALDAATGDHSSGIQDGAAPPTDGVPPLTDAPAATGDSSDATGIVPGDAAEGAAVDARSEAGSPLDATGGSDGAADGGGCATLPSSSLAVQFANSVLARWPNPESLSGTTPAWEYNAGIVLHGLEEVYRRTSTPSYLTYIKQYVDDFVDAAGTVNMPTAWSFDNIQPALLLPFLWQQTGEAKYKTAALNIRTTFNTAPTNAAGGFWHKSTYPNQMWLDGIYMGEPFLARYGSVWNCDGETFCFDTATKQITLLGTHAQTAPVAGLLYHAWDDSQPPATPAAWANPTTGLSPEVWGRGQGWYAMALVDVLGYMPESYAGRSQLLTILQNLAAGLKASQDPTSGLWYEVVDSVTGSCANNWLETSGSGMYVYALRVAVDRGYIDSSYMTVVNLGWTGLQKEVTMDATGPVITNAAAGLDPEPSCAGYINVAKEEDSSQGECAILLAASVMEATCP
jgi:unsaturated rhamnogalacturonyl hydrolase